MSVHYKFKSALDFDTVAFDGLHISVADLKKAIFHQKRIGKNTDFDLQITNAQTKEDYTDDNALIAKNTSLIIARVPLTAHQKRSWDRSEVPLFNSNKDESNLTRAADLTRLDGSEEDKIRVMMTQSTQEYDPSNYMKIRGSNQVGEVPSHYRCHRCHQPGHWIKNCPLGANQESIEIKKSTGIPRSFMVPVDGPLVPGAMMTPGGTYAVPAIDHQAYKEGKKEKPPFAPGSEEVIEKPEIPEDLVCSICKDLLTDAVMIPCCGNSFCDECIRSFLLESEDHECPDCNEKDVSPESLIPNRFLRNGVSTFKNETGYAKPFKAKLKSTPAPEPFPIVNETIVLTTVAPEVSATNIDMSSQNIPLENQTGQIEQPMEPAIPAPLYEKDVHSAGLVESEVDPVQESIAKMASDSETEVPPPPGTEPPLLPKRNSDQLYESNIETKDDYSKDRYVDRDNRRSSFSRENNHRDRNMMYHNRIENARTSNRRRSVSPRNSHSEYVQSLHSNSGKSYHGQHENRYHQTHVMHFDPNLRRSTEERAGTPTVDEPHLHTPTLHSYPTNDERIANSIYASNAPPPPVASQVIPQAAPPGQNMMPDPYMASQHPRMPMYPPHQQPPVHNYSGPPGPMPPRYERPYQQQGYRPLQPRGVGGPPRPMRGGIHGGYRGIQAPPSVTRPIPNGNQGVIDDPLEAFQRMLREKDERDRRLGKHRRRTRSRSRSRSYSRSRSRSFGRRSPARISRSRSPLPKRKLSRSPLFSHKNRSRTPKRRSRSGSFSISRSRSYSRSPSPRLPPMRDRDRLRNPPARYRSPLRSPVRFPKDRDRERNRPRSREYGGFYVDTESTYRDRERMRYPPRAPAHSMPPVSDLSETHAPRVPSHPPPGPVLTQGSAIGHVPLDRKDYYDSYNRYPAAPIPPRPAPPPPTKRYEDVAPPGTEGYYDVPPPGVEEPEKPLVPKDHEPPRESNRPRSVDREERRPPEREKDDREKIKKKEKDDREVRDKEKERDLRHSRDEKRDHDKHRYKDDRDHHRSDDKSRTRTDRDRERRDYDHDRDTEHRRSDRHDRSAGDKKRSRRSPSPLNSSKHKEESKDVSPEKPKKKDKDHDEKADDKRKEKKVREKKKKKDNEEREKKKKKKREKKASMHKETVSSAGATSTPKKLHQEPQADKDSKPAVPNQDDSSKLEETKSITETSLSKISLNLTLEEQTEKILAEAFNIEHIEPVVENIALEALSPKISNKEENLPLVEHDLNESDDKIEIHTETEKELTAEIGASPIITGVTDSPKPKEEIKEEIKDENAEDDEMEEGELKDSSVSPKGDEFLAPLPEPSKWEIEEGGEKIEDDATIPKMEKYTENEEDGKLKIVTNEVIKRAENAIFQKAINAIRPIEIKKICDSRKILYQNPEPKVLDPEIENELNKNLNVTMTVNVGKNNERNVEITSELAKKVKSERSKIKGSSPPRLSVKERLGDKVEDDDKPSIKCIIDTKLPKRSRSPRTHRSRRSMSIDNEPLITNKDRKVFVDDYKRDFSRSNRNESSSRKLERAKKIHEHTEVRKTDRITRTPPVATKIRKNDEESKEDWRKKNRLHEERKRRREREESRSRSKERKKRKEHRKHKREKEKVQKRSKEKDLTKEKADDKDDKTENTDDESATEASKKQRKNPKLTSDRKKSIDESKFEPNYSASSESEDDEKQTSVAKKRTAPEPEVKICKKKAKKSSSEEEESSSTESSSSDSDSSVELRKKKKKRKHKKHRKRKSKKETSSDSDDSDSSDSSSEEERKRKKKKSKKKHLKKKKKSKHK